MASQTRYQHVGQIVGTNTLRVHPRTNAMSVALDLLDSHTSGAPVIDDQGRYVGFISEVDLLKAARDTTAFEKLSVDEIMTRHLESVSPTTSIEEAIRAMEQKHLILLPVVENGVLLTTVSRHDLLRVILDVGLGIEQ